MKNYTAAPKQVVVLVLAVAFASSAPLWADNSRLRSQLRDRKSVIEAETRTLELQTREAEFGGRLYWQLRRSISALEQERTALSRLDSALTFGRESELQRRESDYRRAQQESMRQGEALARVRSDGLQFGSSAWHANQRVASSLQQQRRAKEAFGMQYRDVLERQIRFLETQRSQIEFGSTQWHAVNRQITVLRQALSSVR
jgi:type II secretory pathway pseudopilin PulG